MLRLTGAAGTAIPVIGGVWGAVARHQYSKVSAWNCDQSLMFLLNRGGTPGLVFLDGGTFAPLSVSATPDSLQEFRWHPTTPNTAVFVSGNKVSTWNVRTGQTSEIGSFPQYKAVGIGPWEGNLSYDGEWIVLAGNVDPVTDVFAFNLRTRETLAPVRHTFASVDFATISPSGRYVLVNGATSAGYDRTQVFDRSGAMLGTWPEYGRPSHFDLTLDANGDDIAVGVSKSAPDEGSVIARRLRDGVVTRLTSTGYAGHTSARNTQARGKVVSSFGPSAEAWGPNSDLALTVSTARIDDVQIVGKLYWTLNDYWAEPQPTISPDGRMVVWASKQGGTEVAAYLAKLPQSGGPTVTSTPLCSVSK